MTGADMAQGGREALRSAIWAAKVVRDMVTGTRQCVSGWGFSRLARRARGGACNVAGFVAWTRRAVRARAECGNSCGHPRPQSARAE